MRASAHEPHDPRWTTAPQHCPSQALSCCHATVATLCFPSSRSHGLLLQVTSCKHLWPLSLPSHRTSEHARAPRCPAPRPHRGHATATTAPAADARRKARARSPLFPPLCLSMLGRWQRLPPPRSPPCPTRPRRTPRRLEPPWPLFRPLPRCAHAARSMRPTPARAGSSRGCAMFARCQGAWPRQPPRPAHHRCQLAAVAPATARVRVSTGHSGGILGHTHAHPGPPLPRAVSLPPASAQDGRDLVGRSRRSLLLYFTIGGRR